MNKEQIKEYTTDDLNYLLVINERIYCGEDDLNKDFILEIKNELKNKLIQINHSSDNFF